MMPARDLDHALGLRALLSGWIELDARYERPVSGLCADSRVLVPGDLFLARPGARHDARAYLDQAIAAGAAAVVMQADVPGVELRGGVPVIGLPGLARAMGAIADRYFGHPSRDMWVAGVTGTNGKTSVSHFVAQVLHADRPGSCALFGTLGYGRYGDLVSGPHTTPDALTLHRLLADLRGRGARRAVMEVSSHALVQGRVGGVAFDVAAFTNLSREHLDYHGDMAAYADAKRGLFYTPGLRYAVLNADDAAGREIHSALTGEVDSVGYSLVPDQPLADVRTLNSRIDARGICLEVVTPWGKGRIESPLLGRFNAANLLAALAILLTLGMPMRSVLARLGQVCAVPGRMQRYGGGADRPLVVVDYAHTPDALAQVLATLRGLCRGSLWCVFGCGGERDQGKRPLMARAAEERADRLVLTDDNPRGEDPGAIIRDMLAGLAQPSAALTISDRGQAIARALGEAGPGDVVLVAGKGHEDYQEVAGERRPFSDGATVAAALEEGGG